MTIFRLWKKCLYFQPQALIVPKVLSRVCSSHSNCLTFKLQLCIHLGPYSTTISMSCCHIWINSNKLNSSSFTLAWISSPGYLPPITNRCLPFLNPTIFPLVFQVHLPISCTPELESPRFWIHYILHFFILILYQHLLCKIYIRFRFSMLISDTKNPQGDQVLIFINII